MIALRISKSFLLYFTLLLSLPLFSLNLADHAQHFDDYQYVYSKEFVKTKIERMLEKDPSIQKWYSIDDEALTLYASAEDKKRDKAEFKLYFGSKSGPRFSIPKGENPYLPLKGMRIAIDPGHIGGEFAKIEEKYIDLPTTPSQNIQWPIQFSEGDLNTITARRLAKQLEELGAKVFLTRTQAGKPVYKTPFNQWMAQSFEGAVKKMVSIKTSEEVKTRDQLWWTKQATPSEIFRMTYNFLDVDRRAELINAFKPHLTVGCHYNLGGIYDQNGQTPGVNEDYCLFFVPGAFLHERAPNEAFAQKSLLMPRSRYEFIRFVVSEDIEQSITLAEFALQHTQQAFKTPTGDHCSYLKVLSLKNQDGIYHRNLSLPKLVHSPFLYGEPLCQDNYTNAKILAQNPDVIINKVVQIYAKSILDWVHAQRENQN